MTTTHFDDKVIIECTDNGKKMEAEVLTFKEEQFLSVSIQRAIKLNMSWNSEKNVYIGKGSGLEFITTGPQKFITN